MARLSPDGAIDRSFSGDGRQIVRLPGSHDSLDALAVDLEGRLVLVGQATVPGPNSITAARLLPDGRPDPTFNGTGQALVGFGGRRSDYGVGRAVAVEDSGRILIGGISLVDCSTRISALSA